VSVGSDGIDADKLDTITLTFLLSFIDALGDTRGGGSSIVRSVGVLLIVIMTTTNILSLINTFGGSSGGGSGGRGIASFSPLCGSLGRHGDDNMM
jgi:hypothetical protein